MTYLESEDLLNLALRSIQNTLDNESKALLRLAEQYRVDIESRVELGASINLLHQTIRRQGKIVCCGVGKSFKIALKTVATLKSLLIAADLLHPTEALHGDLGLLQSKDCLLFFTASGNTPELLQLLPHVPPSIPIVLLTCCRFSKLALNPQVQRLLCAELPDTLKEDAIHGIPAPTVSATLSLVLADATALALAEMVEQDLHKRKMLFSMKHPGGLIGSDLSSLNENSLCDAPRALPLDKDDHGSYASILSLNQVHAHMQGASSSTSTNGNSSTSANGNAAPSLTTSPVLFDSDGWSPTPLNPKLLQAISDPLHPSCLRVSFDAIRKWDELVFLRSTALYACILFIHGDLLYGADTNRLRDKYKATRAVCLDWTGIMDFLREFQRVDVAPSAYFI